MKISARDIDHLSLTLSDPETAATRLQQLGFNLTPEGVEPRCICFQPDQDDVPNYIELLQGDGGRCPRCRSACGTWGTRQLGSRTRAS